MKANKIEELFYKSIKFNTDSNGSWCGSVVLGDGYHLSVAASPDMKSRAAKSFIKEELWVRANELAQNRNCPLLPAAK